MWIVKNNYTMKEQSWLWSHGSWIYNSLCNQCLTSWKLWVWIPFIVRCIRGVILSVTCGRSVVFSGNSGFLHKLNQVPRYNWNRIESGIKHHNPYHCWFMRIQFLNLFSNTAYVNFGHPGSNTKDLWRLNLCIKIFMLTFILAFSLLVPIALGYFGLSWWLLFTPKLHNWEEYLSNFPIMKQFFPTCGFKEEDFFKFQPIRIHFECSIIMKHTKCVDNHPRPVQPNLVPIRPVVSEKKIKMSNV
jgi:hypothetical protein